MARLAPSRSSGARGGHRFYLITAMVMAVINVAAFATANLLGRSTFRAPLIVHAHALVFFGWVAIYLTQNALAATGSLKLHQKLGWVAAGWMVLMVLLGTIVTVRLVRLGHVPFFFQPGYFLVMNPVEVLTFAGLSTWAIVLRRQTEWHKRLHLCAMSMIMGPSLGRLLPLPLLIPFAGPVLFAALLVFPLAGVIADQRVAGRVHPAWLWGIVTMALAEILIEIVSRSSIGASLYSTVTVGAPGALLAPLVYPAFPPH